MKLTYEEDVTFWVATPCCVGRGGAAAGTGTIALGVMVALGSNFKALREPLNSTYNEISP